jgi:hypothetical protein
MDTNRVFNKRYHNINNRMEDNRMVRFLKHLMGAGIGCLIAYGIARGLSAYLTLNP